MNIDNADAGGSTDGVSISQASARPRNVLNAVSEVAEQLRAILQPAQSGNSYDADSLHPLSVDVSSIQLPLQAIQVTLKSFEGNVLDNSNAETANLTGVNQLLDPTSSNVLPAGSSQLSQNDRLRLLSLLREGASLQLSENATLDTVKTAREILIRRSHWFHAYPVLPGATVALTMENLAKQCGLHIFASADDDLGDGMIGVETEHATQPEKQTITIAGTGIVIDVDIENEQVSAVRFAYGSDAHNDPGIEHLLLRLAQKQEWQSLRDGLAYLAALDALSKQLHDTQSQTITMTQGAAQVADAFSMIQSVAEEADKAYKAELETVSYPSELFSTCNGVCLSNHTFPYATLIYSISAPTLFSPTWDAVVQSGFQADEVNALLSLPGTMSVRLYLTSSAQTGNLELECRLNSPVTISAAAGQALCQALAIDNQPDPAMAMLYSLSTANAAADLKPNNRQAIEAVILPHVKPGVVYQLDKQQEHSSSTELSPIRVSLTQPVGLTSTFSVRSLRFATLQQLQAALRILRTQCMLQELLVSVFEDVNASSVIDSLKEEQEVNLEDLLSDKAIDYAALNARFDDNASPPVIHLVYRLSGYPAWQPVTVHLSVTVSVEQGIQLSAVKVESADTGIHEAIEGALQGNDGHQRASEVLRRTRSVMMLLAWIDRRVQRG